MGTLTKSKPQSAIHLKYSGLFFLPWAGSGEKKSNRLNPRQRGRGFWGRAPSLEKDGEPVSPTAAVTRAEVFKKVLLDLSNGFIALIKRKKDVFMRILDKCFQKPDFFLN